MGLTDLAKITNMTQMNIACAENAKVLHYREKTAKLYRSKSAKHDVSLYMKREDAVADPYRDCGCHPDIVIRIGDEIGKSLPIDCRCLVVGAPALAHPQHGFILALGLGTNYAIRVPTACLKEAKQLVDANIDNQTMKKLFDFDIQRDLGDDWIYGAWKDYEVVWCKILCDQYTQSL